MDSLAVILLVLTSAVGVSTNPPNILYIMADDLGFNDVSWNNPDVVTPNLQALVDDGVTLDQSYSQAACTPSRAAYLTGYYPFRIGVQNSVVREGMDEYIPLEFEFLPQRLREAGYTSHLVGKWHLGSCRRDVTPVGRGFDTFLGLVNGYNDYYTKKIMAIGSHEDFDPTAQGTIYDFFNGTEMYSSPEDEYTTDIFTERTQELITELKGTPWYIALHYTAPHWPLQMPPNVPDSLYADVTDSRRRMYLAMVTAMDEGIGKVIDTLKEEGELDNTIVIFQSDNGGDTHFAASNEPLRERKTTLYEGGVRVPSMAYSPLFENTPRVSHDLFHIVDWFTTILMAAGVNPGPVDGVSQYNMLRYGTKGPRDTFIYNIHGENAAIRLGKYKLTTGDIMTFQARKKRSSSARPAFSIREKRDEPCPGLPSRDMDKLQAALESLHGDVQGIEGQHLSDMDSILEALENYAPGQNSLIECNNCELYDLEADPSETNDLVSDLPGVVIYMRNLLGLYQAEEVTPVLKYPFEEDPRSVVSKEQSLVSLTWCEA